MPFWGVQESKGAHIILFGWLSREAKRNNTSIFRVVFKRGHRQTTGASHLWRLGVSVRSDSERFDENPTASEKVSSEEPLPVSLGAYFWGSPSEFCIESLNKSKTKPNGKHPRLEAGNTRHSNGKHQIFNGRISRFIFFSSFFSPHFLLQLPAGGEGQFPGFLWVGLAPWVKGGGDEVSCVYEMLLVFNSLVLDAPVPGPPVRPQATFGVWSLTTKEKQLPSHAAFFFFFFPFFRATPAVLFSSPHPTGRGC